MKKSSFVLTILATIFAVLGIVLLGLTPTIAGANSWMTAASFGEVATSYADIFFGPAGSYLAAWNLVTSGNIYAIVAFAVACVFVVTWLIHLILVFARRRYRSLFPNIMWLIGGFVLTGFVCGAIVPDFLPLNADALATSTSHNIINVWNYLFVGESSYIKVAGDNAVLNWVYAILMLLPYALFTVGWILGLIGCFVAIGDCVAHPGVKKQKENAARAKALKDARLPVDDNDALKAALYDELDPSAKPVVATPAAVTTDKSGDTPIIVQHIYYNGQPAQTITSTPEPKKEEEEKKVEPTPAIETTKEPQKEIHIHIYNPGPEPKKEEEEKKVEPTPVPEVKPAPTPVIEEENRPLTARELRSIIKEALDDHDHPDNDKPLTDEEARNLVREELNDYYAKTLPVVEEEDDVDLLPEEDLYETVRQIIHEELEDVLSAHKEESKEKPAVEEKKEETPASSETLTKDEIKAILEEELTSLKEEMAQKEAEKKAEEEAKAKAEEEAKAKAEEEAKAKAEEEAKAKAEEEEKARLEAETKAKEEAERRAHEAEEAARIREKNLNIQKEVDDAQNAAIASIRDSMLKAEDIRAIIAEELAKLPKPEPVVVEKEVEVPAPAPEPVVENKVEPVVEETKPATEEVKEAKPKIIRIPFPTRLLDADDEMKANYNELKAECLSYGLKSRLSNSGDTFRLHTKTYVKITVAGKSLKLYLALDPKDYENSTIPVKDAGGKNIYREIPVVFKVKSALSMKRAKQLIADACEHDDLEQGKIIEKDYVHELIDYRPQNASGAEDDEDDEE